MSFEWQPKIRVELLPKSSRVYDVYVLEAKFNEAGDLYASYMPVHAAWLS